MNETETRLSSSRDHWLARMRRKVDLVPLSALRHARMAAKSRRLAGASKCGLQFTPI